MSVIVKLNKMEHNKFRKDLNISWFYYIMSMLINRRFLLFVYNTMYDDLLTDDEKVDKFEKFLNSKTNKYGTRKEKR